jgi:hypothetical protein
MAPTLEEYSQILGYSLWEIDTKPTYKCLKKYSSMPKDIAPILRVNLAELNGVIENYHQIKTIPQEYLEKRMEDLANKKRFEILHGCVGPHHLWDSFVPTHYKLCRYGSH